MQEQEAIRQCQAGEQEALGVLFQLHQQAVFRTAFAITRNYDLAEDITQEVFIELFTAIKKYDLSRPFPPWLHRIAVHRSLDKLRKLRHSASRDLPIEDADNLPGTGIPPEQAALDTELAAAIWVEVWKLSPKHRAVVVLYHYHGFSVAEISQSLGCLRATVRVRLYYARAHLRDALRGLREPPTDPESEPAVAPKISPVPSVQDWPMQTFATTDERRVKSPVLSFHRKMR